MWWTKKTKEEEQEETMIEEVKVVKVPQGERVDIDEGITQEYKDLCRHLGVISIPTLIASMGLRLYDEDEVEYYLNKKFEGHMKWAWFPLRIQDRVAGFSFHDSNAVYRYPVPLPVLRSIKEIADVIPTAKFFVSSEASASDFKDPFLMVTSDDGHTRYIIERWDEPSFR